jgi:hypothetical protein
MHIITREHIHLDTTVPVVTTTRSADPAITRDTARTVKLLQDTGVTTMPKRRIAEMLLVAKIRKIVTDNWYTYMTGLEKLVTYMS